MQCSIPFKCVSAICCLATIVLFFQSGARESCAADAAQRRAKAERIYAGALEAELAGNLDARASRLREALAVDAEFAPARWRLGEIREGTPAEGKWTPIAEITKRWAVDARLAEYQNRRSAVRDGVAGNTALAEWAASQKLTDESRLHWLRVAQQRPADRNARRQAHLRRVGERIVSFREFDSENEAKRAAIESADRWKPRVAHLLRDIASDDKKIQAAARRALRGIRDVGAIPTLEAALSITNPKQPFDELAEQSPKAAREKKLNLHYVAILRGMPEPPATKALVREAVLSASDEIRTAAIAALAERPWHHFVPRLLAGLASPVEATVSVTADAAGRVLYRRSYFREGPNADTVVTYDAMFDYFYTGPVLYPDEVRFITDELPVPPGEVRAIRRDAVATRKAVDRANAQLLRLNDRIGRATSRATAVNLPAQPTAWWRWWQDYNELHVPDEKPLYEQTYARYYTNWAVDPTSGYFAGSTQVASCFAAGTPVVTKTGPQPIETIRIGDFVLAQDDETGELAFKPVTGRTVRPATPLVAVRIGGQVIRVTRGHPFWVAGVNWIRAKQLAAGDRVHTPYGPVAITSVAEAPAEETYNLIVADNHNYFVGQHQVLVHDNTPTTPTIRKLPGV